MNFKLDAEYLEIQRQARALAASIDSVAAEADASNEIHAGVLSALQASGLCALMVPAEFGGRSERPDPSWPARIRPRPARERPQSPVFVASP